MKKRRWIIKAGSQMVCAGGPKLVASWMKQIARLKSIHNIEVIWVTSGAIATAAIRTSYKNTKKTLPEKQALSAIGQPLIMNMYNTALDKTNLLGAQVLLTAGDMKDRARRRNLQNTFEKLLAWDILPIVNENDAVATEEIQFGDNDALSAKIAIMMKAERLILLTDVDGFYNSNPRTNKNAKLISHIKNVTKKDLKNAGAKTGGSKVGTGGMYSKLIAAENANKNKIITHLMRGDHLNNLLMIANGHLIGTQVGGKIGRSK
jgi:glutamate 5-kinase